MLGIIKPPPVPKKDLSFCAHVLADSEEGGHAKIFLHCQSWSHTLTRKRDVRDNKPILRGYPSTQQIAVFRPFKLELNTQD
mgnify:FL=1